MEKVENIGGHYAKTLRLWREAFLANFDEKIRPALEQENPGMSEEEAEVFRRKWEVSTLTSAQSPREGDTVLAGKLIIETVKYYFTYCEAGFLTKTLGDVIITVGRECSVELMEGIPL